MAVRIFAKFLQTGGNWETPFYNYQYTYDVYTLGGETVDLFCHMMLCVCSGS